MSAAQDRAEVHIRAMVTVGDLCTLPKWPGYARRIVAALEGVDRLPWGALRAMFREVDYDGPFGAGYVVDHLVDAGMIARVFWDLETGHEVEDQWMRDVVVGKGAPTEDLLGWAERTAFGYRLVSPTERPEGT